jgi:hypothetical protein
VSRPVRDLTRAQRNLRDCVESAADDPFRRMEPGRVLAQWICGHVHTSLEQGIEDAAQRWRMSEAELRELMADYGLEAGVR